MNDGVLMHLTLPILEFDTLTDGVIYTRECVDKCILNEFTMKEMLEAHTLLGEFGVGNEYQFINPTRASHCVTKLFIKDNMLLGEVDIIDTPNGRVVYNLVKDYNVVLRLLPRGTITDMDKDTRELKEIFVHTFDIVPTGLTKHSYF